MNDGGLTSGAFDYSFGTQDIFSSALHVGADPTFTTTRTSDTVATDAVAGSVMIDNSQGTGWQGFFQDTARALVGYTLAKDAQQNNVVQPGKAPTAQQSLQSVSGAPNQKTMLLLVGGIVGVVLLTRALR